MTNLQARLARRGGRLSAFRAPLRHAVRPSRRIGAALIVLLLLLSRSVAAAAQTAAVDQAFVRAEQTLADAPADWFVVLNTGDVALDWRLRAIDSAVSTIDIESFIWKPDRVGEQVRDHLRVAAERGVKVRILVDDSFLLGQGARVLAFDDHPNIEVKVYNPYRRRSSSAALRTALNLAHFRRLNHRMHNKVMVVDGVVAIIGGRNIADEYYGFDQRLNFRDLELIAGGPGVRSISGSFEDYWNDRWSTSAKGLLAPPRRRGVQRPTPGSPTLSHVEETAMARLGAWALLRESAHSGSAELLIDRPPLRNPGRRDQAPVQLAQALVKAMGAARSEIIIVTPYLIPTDDIEQAIHQAEQRGVEVRILTNSINSTNHLIAHSAYRRKLYALLRRGAEIHETRADAKDRATYIADAAGGARLGLHAKAMVIDDELVFVGSANLDPRSLTLNTEIGLLVSSPALNRDLRRLLAPDLDPRNAWRVGLAEDGRIVWSSDDRTIAHQPANTLARGLEDWLLAFLPVEEEL